MKRICLLLIFAGTGVAAHERSESYSHWYPTDSAVTGTITIPLREVMLLYQVSDSAIPPREMFRRHVAEQVSVSGDDGACDLRSTVTLEAPSGFVRTEVSFACGASAPQSLRYRALFDAAPGHVHYAKLHLGEQMTEILVTDSADTWNISEAVDGNIAPSFLAYLRIGIEHISTGYDHIAFLLGLLLISGSLGRTVIAVTGFTLGHSVSLAAAVLGYVSADGQLVEAFIGFTVALVAVEYFVVRRDSARVPAIASLAIAWATGLIAVQLGLLQSVALFAYCGFGVFAACYIAAARSGHGRLPLLLFAATTCFGLVHGFGFAGFLMETGLQGGALLVPLLGFNLGVEAGQLLLVAAALAAYAALGRFLPRATPAVAAASLCGIGVFWFVTRTIA